jgi:hypothetical protein
MNNCNPTRLPIPAGTVLQPDTEEPLDHNEATVYRQIVGSTIYLANCTRPDISYAVGQLARFMATPGQSHYRLSKQLLRYLNGTRETGITYSDRPIHLPLCKIKLTSLPASYTIFTDATWGTEHDRISFQGMAVVRYGGAVIWMAQRQKSTALSSMEAEIMAASEGARSAVWLEKLTRDLGERDDVNPFIPTLYCDNKGAVDLSYDTKHHQKAKHIETRYLFVRNDMVQRKRLAVVHIPGKDQPGDMLTKQLPFDDFMKHCKTLGISG